MIDHTIWNPDINPYLSFSLEHSSGLEPLLTTHLVKQTVVSGLSLTWTSSTCVWTNIPTSVMFPDQLGDRCLGHIQLKRTSGMFSPCTSHFNYLPSLLWVYSIRHGSNTILKDPTYIIFTELKSYSTWKMGIQFLSNFSIMGVISKLLFSTDIYGMKWRFSSLILTYRLQLLTLTIFSSIRVRDIKI